MKTPPGYPLVAAAGVGLYALAAFAPLAFSRAFWTEGTLGSEVPWYFMGQTFIEGIAAAVALILCVLLGAVAARRYGANAWGALMPAFLFLAPQFGRGVAVLLHSSRIWDGPPVAESDWRSFADYAAGMHRAQFVSLALATAALVGLGLLLRRKARMEHAASDAC